MTPMNCSLLVGTGKSGSKRALKVLDLSPMTHCRCEPHELPSTAFAELPSPQWVGNRPGEFKQGMRQQWDIALQWAAGCLGERDRPPAVAKRHLRGPLARAAASMWIGHRSLRRALGWLMPAMLQPEWPLPRWCASPQRLSEAMVVLKLGPVPAWACWVMREMPRIRVFHVIRHPAGFLQAYRHRWLSRCDLNLTTRLNRERLAKLRRLSPDWADVIPNPQGMAADEAELWWWRYVNESMHDAGQTAPGYLRVLDEQLTADPLAMGKRMFAHAGLPWTSQAQRYLSSVTQHWQSHAGPWANLVSARDKQWIRSVLCGSSLESLWEQYDRVSDCHYHAY